MTPITKGQTRCRVRHLMVAIPEIESSPVAIPALALCAPPAPYGTTDYSSCRG